MKVHDAKNIGSLSLIVLLLSTIHVIINNTGPAAAEQDPASTASTDEVAAASGSNRFAVWNDETPGNFEIFFRRSTDNGVTWQPVVRLSINPGPSFSPQLAVSGSNVYVVWHQRNFDDTRSDVFFRRSTDNGATWGATVNLSSSGQGGFGEIAVSGSNVYVVWDDSSFGNAEVFLRRSTDGGATWKSIVNISNNGSPSSWPNIAISGSKVYVVWSNWRGAGEFEILFRRSLDGGATWGASVNISKNPTRSQAPEIAASGSNVYVAWPDGMCFSTDKNCHILFSRSANSGVSWTSVENLSDTPNDSVAPQFAVSGSNVYLVWEEERAHKDGSFEDEIYFRRSTDGGATWKPIVNLSNNPGHSTFPQIAISSSNVYVVWDQSNKDQNARDSFFRRSTDNGATWGANVNLSASGQAGSPKIAVSGSNIYTVYTVEFDYPNREVFFKRSTNDGATWGSAKNLSNNSGLSADPRIAV